MSLVTLNYMKKKTIIKKKSLIIYTPELLQWVNPRGTPV